MIGWQLQLRQPPPGDVDARFLGAAINGLSVEQILHQPLPLLGCRHPITIGDCFAAEFVGDDRVKLVGDFGRFHGLGYRWDGGELVIEGHVGRSVGRSMSGGSITVVGDAEAGAGEQMRGGRLNIGGNAGDDIGRPLPGRRSGMSGGRIVVAGDAGNCAGYRMRRGTIVILGDCGIQVGCNQVAGTIAIGGRVAGNVAPAMRRGTVILSQPMELSTVRFTRPESCRLGIARLIADDLRADAAAIAALLLKPIVRSLGDLSNGGTGEIWMPACDR